MKLATLVLFNHRFDRNLPVLDQLLKDRFSNIFYIIPFYDGDREDVIPVYGRSIFFETYLAQAYNIVKDKGFDHYLVVADDMILNPELNERNYMDFFEVEKGQSFIPMLKPLHTLRCCWLGTMESFLYKPEQKYVETKGELPSKEEALKRFERQGIELKPLTRQNLFDDFTLDFKYLGDKLRLGLRTLTRLRHPFKNEYELHYPLVASYSDILLIANEDMKEFAHYCGVFGATSLFVEVAIPTALALAAKKEIKTEEKISHKGRSYWAIPEKTVFCEDPSYTWDALEKEYKNLDDLMERFPKEAIYLHPVKLSKWMKK